MEKELFIQTCDVGESPYAYYIPVPDVGNMYFDTKKEAKEFIAFYYEYQAKKSPKNIDGNK